MCKIGDDAFVVSGCVQRSHRVVLASGAAYDRMMCVGDVRPATAWPSRMVCLEQQDCADAPEQSATAQQKQRTRRQETMPCSKASNDPCASRLAQLDKQTVTLCRVLECDPVQFPAANHVFEQVTPAVSQSSASSPPTHKPVPSPDTLLQTSCLSSLGCVRVLLPIALKRSRPATFQGGHQTADPLTAHLVTRPSPASDPTAAGGTAQAGCGW